MKIAVIGSGIMGSGIAHAFLKHDFNVVLVDLNQAALDDAQCKISALLNKETTLTEALIEQKLNQIQFTQSLEKVKDADIVIEAATEKKEVKKNLLRQIDSICDSQTIIVTNTSSYSITDLASVTKRPDKFAGLHFFNPVHLMKLIEVIAAEQTAQSTLEFLIDLTKRIEKDYILVDDSPLFVVNRILVPMISEAIFVYEENIASAEDIDKGMKLGTNQPIGPLALADLIGLDTLLSVQESLYNETGDTKYRIPYTLKKLVRAGHYGRKTKKGFYEYS